MKTLTLVLLIFSFVCFGLATVNVPTKFNLIALGLLFWVLTIIIPLMA